jgi:hypothetical protein
MTSFKNSVKYSKIEFFMAFHLFLLNSLFLPILHIFISRGRPFTDVHCGFGFVFGWQFTPAPAATVPFGDANEVSCFVLVSLCLKCHRSPRAMPTQIAISTKSRPRRMMMATREMPFEVL